MAGVESEAVEAEAVGRGIATKVCEDMANGLWVGAGLGGIGVEGVPNNVRAPGRGVGRNNGVEVGTMRDGVPMSTATIGEWDGADWGNA